MAASYSRPGCKACEAMADNVGCGVCLGLVNQDQAVRKKRGTVVRRAFERAGIGPTDRTTQRATLKCGLGHYWQSETIGGREDSVRDPQCPTCQGFLVAMSVVQGTLNEDVPCTDECKYAKTEICSCACGGINHGI